MKRWVAAKEEFKVCRGGNVVSVVPFGTTGFVKHVDPAYNQSEVVFPMAEACFHNSYLDIADLPTIEQALDIIKSYTGHHSGHGQVSKYQFDIKVHYDRVPVETLLYLTEDEVSALYWGMLHRDLHVFMGEEGTGGLKQTFDWITSWHTAGRTGGWLVLEHNCHWMNYEELTSEWEHQRNILDNHEDYANEDVTLAHDRLQDATSAIYDLAMDLQLISKKVELGIAATTEYVSSIQAWQPHIDRKKGVQQ